MRIAVEVVWAVMCGPCRPVGIVVSGDGGGGGGELKIVLVVG